MLNEARQPVHFPEGIALTTIKNFLERRQRGLIFALPFKKGW